MKREELGILYPIKLVRYDLKWPELFLKEKGILERIWYGQIRIEHIGSTAVPGLSAKPTIDILMEKPLDMRDEVIIERMEENEYLHMKKQTRHLMFVKGYGKNGLESESYHIHMGPLDQEWLWDRVFFRDLLRSDRKEAHNYEYLKRELASRHRNDREAYTEAKSEYIERATKEAKARLKVHN